MSILLSAYFPEGIVFAADKNATLLYGQDQDVEVGVATKVLIWPRRRAVVGYCGLGQLADNALEEWMRRFIASTADFDELPVVAQQMRDLVQQDFARDHPEGSDVTRLGLIVHLGGFTYEGDVPVPAMYHFSNTGLDPKTGYTDATRNFGQPGDDLRRDATKAGEDDPRNYRSWLEGLYATDRLMWYNNGYNIAAFNVVKGKLWEAITLLRESQVIPIRAKPSLQDRVAYCAMAVELYGSFFRHHYLPKYRSVGGGADVQWIPWPEA